jgi:hypothetical protein
MIYILRSEATPEQIADMLKEEELRQQVESVTWKILGGVQ